jgi:outer membrane protein TolC
MVYEADQRVAAVRAEIADLDRRREAIVGELGGLSGVIQALAVPEPTEQAPDRASAESPAESPAERIDGHPDLGDDEDDRPDAVHETVPPTHDPRPSNSED